MPVEVYLVRHGETVWNKEHRVQGRLNSPLTLLGKQHAVSSARILKRVLAEKDTAFSFQVSPQGRARETAGIIQQHCGFDAPIVDERLRELNYGLWEGLTSQEIEARWPGMRGRTSPPEGEPLEQCRARMSHWLKAQSGVVVAISHGMASRMLRGAILELTAEESLGLPVPQGTVWRIHRGNVDLLEH